jgi:hypothetical protein
MRPQFQHGYVYRDRFPRFLDCLHRGIVGTVLIEQGDKVLVTQCAVMSAEFSGCEKASSKTNAVFIVIGPVRKTR